MNSDIQIIDMLSDNPSGCSPIWSPGDELADTACVIVIIVAVTEMVTVLVAMVVDVELMS